MTHLPVGHYLGAFHPGPGEDVAYHRIRIGDAVVYLTDAAELRGWLLTDAVPAPVADRLVAAGALVPLPDPGPDTLGFAAAYRLRPLLSAVGPVPGGASFGLGAAGHPVAAVDALLLDLWWWSGPSADLWTACERAAGARSTEPVRVLEHFLRHGRDLLAAGAAYLDVNLGR
jgi:hypothetical protein